MEYRGRYPIFDLAEIKTVPLKNRRNKVSVDDLILPEQALKAPPELDGESARLIEEVAGRILSARKKGQPVLFFTGAHLIKNGLSLLVMDLIERGIVTLVGTHGAGAIHDFELALIGETSENVPNALPEGQFGMAYEFCYINEALKLGNELKLGYGEALGRMMCERAFFSEVLSRVGRPDSPQTFAHPCKSLLACAYRTGVPFTVHASIGTDVTDQHPGFSAEAKGGCSGRDFLIFVHEVTKFAQGGGVVLNVGSAVTGPEVLLKAISMVSNAGHIPTNMFTADFDLRPYHPQQMSDEAATGYYYRDQKSVVTRIPQSFGGKGVYVQGNQKWTMPYLYRCILSGG
jgi:hypothetical protein